MSIVIDQQPDQFSWTSTMKDYIITATEDVSFTLQVDNQVILTEKYSPDSAGKIYIRNLGKVCRSYLEGDLFPTDHVQYNLFKLFTATINGTNALLMVQRCDIYLKTVPSFLTVGGSIRTTTLESIERLSAFTTVPFVVKLISIANEELTELGPFTLFTPSNGHKIYTVDVSPSAIQAISVPFIGTIIGYKVQVGGASMTYLLEKTMVGMKQFLYQNSFGVPEYITLFPETKNKLATTSETAVINDTSYRLNIQRNDSIEEGNILANTVDALRRLRDMFSSEIIKLHIDDEWIDIMLTDVKDENSQLISHLQPISFNYKIANPKYGYRL